MNCRTHEHLHFERILRKWAYYNYLLPQFLDIATRASLARLGKHLWLVPHIFSSLFVEEVGPIFSSTPVLPPSSLKKLRGQIYLKLKIIRRRSARRNGGSSWSRLCGLVIIIIGLPLPRGSLSWVQDRLITVRIIRKLWRKTHIALDIVCKYDTLKCGMNITLEFIDKLNNHNIN